MSFAPNETPSELWLERSNLIGSYLSTVGFGLQAAIYFFCTYYFHQERLNRRSWAFFSYNTALFLASTLSIVSQIKYCQMVWIDYRNIPGGPLAALSTPVISNSWVFTLGDASGVVSSFLADALLLWRCFIVWDSSWRIIAFPFSCLIGSAVMSALAVFEAAVPGNSLWTKTTVNFAIPYGALSIGLNVMLTLLIVGRLLSMRRRVKEALGAEHAEMYTSLAAMIIESAAPFTLLSFAYLITYTFNNPVQNIFLPLWVQSACIFPQLIILRVAYGRSWSQEAASKASGHISTLRWTTRHLQNSQTVPDSTTTVELGEVSESDKHHEGAEISEIFLQRDPERGSDGVKNY